MTNPIARSGSRGIALAAVTALLFTLSVPARGQSPGLSFSKAFEPSTIAPGGISTLTFQIQSSASGPATGIAFTDVFPAGVTIAEPSGLSSDCGVGATLTGPVGGSTVALSGATLAPGASCEARVNVTAGAPGLYANVSSNLTWDQGSAPPASADLTVAADRPTFSKSFAPDNIVIGKTSTLTFTIENLSGNNVFNGSFTDFLPGGLAVASPANIATDCTGNLIAEPGGNSIQLFSGFFPPGNLCTISVDVRADDAAGARDNLTSDFTSTAGSSGKAGDMLDVRIDPLIKRFSDDPVPPGETATLEFEIRNFDRFDALTGITFTDDLDATLSGLVAVGTPINDVCGPGSQLSGTSTLTLSGGSIPASGQCSFSVPVQVPAGAAPGIYPNTTSPMSGSLGGTPQTFDPASDDLAVADFVRLGKTFIPSAIGAGGNVDLELTLSNTSATNAASSINFTDGLGSFLNGATPTNLPLNACGGTLQFIGVPEPSLFFSNGSLAAGEDCTLTAILNIPAGTPGGQYPNTTGDVTAVLDGVERVGPGASDTLTVLGAPAPTKTFIDDPADPGGTTTLEFTLSHDEFATADATDIGFSDDLNATLTGLAAIGTPLSDVCGAGSQLSGTGTLALTGGTLAPGETCVFSVTLQVPAGATPGVYPNVTSAVTATVAGEPTTGRTASDDLLVSGLEADKTFVDSPVVPGDTTTLEFTLTNDNPVLAATAISFSDDLDATLPGLAPLGLPLNDVCGAGSQLIDSGGNLILAGGSLGPSGSCTFSVTLQVPAATPSGVYSNTTSDIQATYDGSVGLFPPATDSLEVNGELIELSKAFTDDPVAPGAAVTLEFTLANASASDAITNIAFTDDLDAALPGLASTSGIQNDVCGSGSQLSGTSVLTLTGASLPAGGSCTFSATLSVPASVPTATDFINTTSAASGELNGLQVSGLPATDALVVNLVGFSKSFDGPSTATGTAVLTFMLDNQGSGPVSGLAFTDDLDAVLPGLVATGLPQPGICGAGSQITGSSLLAFSGGELAAGESCSFQVQLAIPAGALPGTFLNTTSDLFSAGLPIAAPASDSLDIEPPPAFTKVFVPVTISSDAVSTLSFDIDNGASALAASDLAFTDPLPAGTQIANPPNATSTCGGTLSAAAGSGTIALSGGSVASGASCSISVDVSAASEGVYDNVSGDLTSSSGNSGPASATLEVVGADFTVAKAFASQPVLPGGLVDLELTITNDSQFALEDIALSDDLGAVLAGLAAEGLPLNDACGAGSQVSGTSVITLANGSVPANDQCTIVVPVRVPGDATAGSFLNTTSTATGTRQGVDVQAPAASAELVVDVLQFSKSVTPQDAAAGTSIDISFEFTNPDPVNTAEGLSFTDDLDAFVPGMTSADTPQSGICGAGSLIDGTGVLSFTGGSVPPSGSCAFTVSADIPADAQAGDYTNVTSAVSGSVDGEAFEADGASAPLSIQAPPAFTKVFAPAQIGPGQTSTLSFDIDNDASTLAASDLAFTDPLPAGTQIANPPNATSTCGGTLSAAAGSGTIALSGGSVASGASCSISVDVSAASEGVYDNVSGDLTSSSGNSGPASATLEVVGADFTVAKAFASQPVLPGGLVDLELTITNDSQFALEDIALSDDLGAVLAGLAAEGLPLNDACGAGSQVSGTSVITLANGSVPANDQCTIVVPVRVPGDATAGSFLNTTSTATGTRQGVDVQAPAASAELVVDVLQFSKSVTPQDAAAGTSIDISFEFTNPDPVNTAEGLSFTDDLDAFVPGMTSADTPQSGICGAGSLIDGTGVLSFTGGSVPPSGSCAFTVSADIPADAQAGDYTNVTSTVSGSVGGQAFESASASAPLGVQVAPAFAKNFAPAQLAEGQSSTLTFTIDNGANALPADDLAFVDPLPPGMQVAESPNAVNGCGGTLTAAAGSSAIELAGGSVAAGGSCTISVDVISAVGGSLTNVTNDLTSSLGNSGPATATLIQYVSVPVTQGRWLAILLLLLAAIGLIHIRRT